MLGPNRERIAKENNSGGRKEVRVGWVTQNAEKPNNERVLRKGH